MKWEQKEHINYGCPTYTTISILVWTSAGLFLTLSTTWKLPPFFKDRLPQDFSVEYDILAIYCSINFRNIIWSGKALLSNQWVLFLMYDNIVSENEGQRIDGILIAGSSSKLRRYRCLISDRKRIWITTWPVDFISWYFQFWNENNSCCNNYLHLSYLLLDNCTCLQSMWFSNRQRNMTADF